MNWFTYRSYHTRNHRSLRPFPGAALIGVRRPVRPVSRSVRAARRAQRATWLRRHVTRVRRLEITGRIALAMSAVAFILAFGLASVQPFNPLERAQVARSATLLQWDTPVQTAEPEFAPPLPSLASLEE
ncbi:hypothetical protein CRI93_00220 [Longimonas halophila]|uniref:Uncharacterized protein n=1 Tax=Longimonas halophila TaxID=1469170 RepID=A0A2H3NPL9_9BACT|nr:hypothetical protein [Longimonas halophila]PEN09193.1 hypothetical protein CRI93_00220 [Longimonas halophila]